jgi:hypothetical protein
MAIRNLDTEFEEEYEHQKYLEIKEEALNFASNSLNMTIEEYNNYVYDYCQGDESKIQKFNESFVRQYERDKYNNRLDNLSWFVNLRHQKFLEQNTSKSSKNEEGIVKSKGIQKSKKSKKSKSKSKNSKKSKKSKKTKNNKNKSKQGIKII